MSVRTSRQINLNIYDILGNFLPGSLLILGIVFPISGPNLIVDALNVSLLILFSLLSFAIGVAIQVIGSKMKSVDNEFNDHMEEIANLNEGEDGITTETGGHNNITPIDAQFLISCNRMFKLSDDFSNWSMLYKLTMAKLDETSKERTLRLHALYLGVRGMTVVAGILSLYYLLYYIGICLGCFWARISWWYFFVIISCSIISMVLFYERQNGFREDIVAYLISEFTMESHYRISSDQRESNATSENLGDEEDALEEFRDSSNGDNTRRDVY